jgi:predicted PurR-regulated permease PerM
MLPTDPPPKQTLRIDPWSVVTVLGIFLLIWIIYLVRDIIALLFTALFLAALINPAARALARKKIPKGVTVLCLYVLLFGIAVLAVGLLLPPLLEQSMHLAQSVGLGAVFSDTLHTLQGVVSEFSIVDSLRAGVPSLGGETLDVVKRFFFFFSDIFGGIVGLVIVLVMAYYMVVQEEEARGLFYQFVPERYQAISVKILEGVEEKIGHWLLGQLALCFLIGLLYYIGLRIIGVPSALVLAFFGAFTEFIPYLGPILGAIPILLLALTQSPFMALLAGIVVVIVQQLENHVIVPKIMQRAVGLNPLISIIALLVGANLFGVVGALLSIPVATALSVVVSELYHYYK